MSDKVVLVTGAARRVGAALAQGLALDGWSVAVHYRHSGDDAAKVVAAIRAAGGQADLFRADLSESGERDALLGKIIARFGRIDALVNNASLFEYDDLSSLTEARWQAHLAANLTAPVFLIRDFARVARDGGAVVNILDHKVEAPNPDFLSYTAGKVGLAGLTAHLALALAPGIRVNGICPGLILRSGDQTEEDYRKAWSDTPLGRGTGLGDMLDAVRFCLSTRGLTGQNIVLDGGESLRPRGRDVAFDPALKD